VRGLVTVTDHKKVFRHVSQPLSPHLMGANLGLSVQNCSHPQMIHGVLSCGGFENQTRA
jgi:hypothetical protein